MRQSLITGIGIWSCLGRSQEEVAKSLRSGTPGIGISHARKVYGYQSSLTGLVPMPDLTKEPLRNAQRKCLSEPSIYAYMAVKQALAQASITDCSHYALIVSNDSAACANAETEGIMETYHDTRRVGGFQVFRSLNSTVSMALASIFGFSGLSLTLSAACAGGGHAVGIAHSLIASGIIDAAVVVGAQEVGTQAYTAFDALGVFSRNESSPSTASRPFDKSRDGLVPSGGAAALVIESEEHYAQKFSLSGRPHYPMAEVLGYGFSTSPNIVSPSADSILAAMRMALGKETPVPQLTTIFPHATSTRDGDSAEAQAISELTKGMERPPLTVPIKALTGHECWMSGVSTIVYAIIQQQGGFVSPHPHLSEKDSAASSLVIPTRSQEYKHGLCLCNSFGFGGTNAAIFLNLLP